MESTYFERCKEALRECPKFESQDREALESHVDLVLRIAGRLGVAARPGDCLLELGCGLGESVEVLVSHGFDAYGVDIAEWWGKDYAAYWQQAPPPQPEIRARLSAVDENHYVLPYPDDHFDLIVSWQTFEHVFNYETVFREIRRVLKPDGISVNIFPGPGTPVEPHVGVPIIPLCKYDWWLALWALRRPSTYREYYRALKRSMKLNNYPSRARLRRYAAAGGLEIEFQERLYVEFSASRASRLTQAARRFGLGRPASALVERICQRTMVLRRPRTAR